MAAFLTTDDYRAVCGDSSLDIILQASEDNRRRAERYAQEEISSYLRGRYDMAAAFAAQGDSRNAQLVMICADIALFHLQAHLPKRQGWETRDIRYQNAVQWLKDAQAGKAAPCLPPLTAEDGSDIGNPIRFGSMAKQTYDW